MRANRGGPIRWAAGLLALGLWCSLTARAGAQVVYRAARPAYGPGVISPNFTRSEPFFWGNGAASRAVPPPGVGRDYYGAAQRFMWPYGYAPARSYGPPLVFGGYLTGPGGRLSYNPFGGEPGEISAHLE